MDAIDSLIGDLHSGLGWMRARAARRLGNQHDPRVLPALERVLEMDPWWEARRGAAFALGRQGTAALPLLHRALWDENPHVRWEVVASVGIIRSEAGLPTLFRAINDASDTVRREAVRSMGLIKSMDALPYLCEALGGSSFDVCLGAAIVIQSLAERNPGRAELATALDPLARAIRVWERGEWLFRAARQCVERAVRGNLPIAAENELRPEGLPIPLAGDAPGPESLPLPHGPSED